MNTSLFIPPRLTVADETRYHATSNIPHRPVASRLVPFCLVLSRLVLSRLLFRLLSRLISSHSVSSCRVLSRFVLSRLLFRLLSRLVSSHSAPFLSHPVSLCLVLSHLFPYRRALSRLISSHSVSSCTVLSRFVLSRLLFRLLSRLVSSHSVPFLSHTISLCLILSHLFPYRGVIYPVSSRAILSRLLSRLIYSCPVSSCLLPFFIVPFRLVLSHSVSSLPFLSIPSCFVYFRLVLFHPMIPVACPYLVSSHLVGHKPLDRMMMMMIVETNTWCWDTASLSSAFPSKKCHSSYKSS